MRTKEFETSTLALNEKSLGRGGTSESRAGRFDSTERNRLAKAPYGAFFLPILIWNSARFLRKKNSPLINQVIMSALMVSPIPLREITSLA